MPLSAQAVAEQVIHPRIDDNQPIIADRDVIWALMEALDVPSWRFVIDWIRQHPHQVAQSRLTWRLHVDDDPHPAAAEQELEQQEQQQQHLYVPVARTAGEEQARTLLEYRWNAFSSAPVTSVLDYVLQSSPIDRYPTSDVIQALITADPRAVWPPTSSIQDSNRATTCHFKPMVWPSWYVSWCSPLQVACSRRASLNTIQALTEARPSIPVVDYKAVVALWNAFRNVFCQRTTTTTTAARRHEPNDGSDVDDVEDDDHVLRDALLNGGAEGWSMLHRLLHLLQYVTDPRHQIASCSRPFHGLYTIALHSDNLDLLQLAIHLFPEQVARPDRHSSSSSSSWHSQSPLHLFLCNTALRHDTARQEQGLCMLHAANPNAIHQRDMVSTASSNKRNNDDVETVYGNLPLHVALHAGTWQHVRAIVQLYPQAVFERDEIYQLLPFQLAACAETDNSLDTVYDLLRFDPRILSMAICVGSNSAVTIDLPEDRALQSDVATARSSKAPLCAFRNSAPMASLSVTTTSAVTPELMAVLDYLGSYPGSRTNALWKALEQLLSSTPLVDSHASASSLSSQTAAPPLTWLACHAAAGLPMAPVGLLQVMLDWCGHHIGTQPDIMMYRLPLHYLAAQARIEMDLVWQHSLSTEIHPIVSVPLDHDDSCASNDDDDDNDGDDDDDPAYSWWKQQYKDHLDVLSSTSFIALPFLKRLRLLLRYDPHATRVRDATGCLPLHIASYHGMPLIGLMLLIQSWPGALWQPIAVSQQDTPNLFTTEQEATKNKHIVGLVPVLLAACSPHASLDHVYQLLIAAPDAVLSCHPRHDSRHKVGVSS